MWWNQKKFLNQRSLSEDLLDPWPALTVPSPALITPLPANIFTNRLAPNVPNNVLRNLPFILLLQF